jgi:hypothetical protein
MLENELKELEASIDDINSGLERVYRIINHILSHPAKNYDLTFKKEVFHLTPPFTLKEEIRLQKIRSKYITLIMDYVLKKRVRKLKGDPDYLPKDIFEIWYALAYGEDPVDHQIKKITMEEIYEIQDTRDEKYGNSRPLDEEAYQVRMQDNKKVKESSLVKDNQ